jgi:hypothetical protein
MGQSLKTLARLFGGRMGGPILATVITLAIVAGAVGVRKSATETYKHVLKPVGHFLKHQVKK